jgi:hypothetical protein
MFAVNMLTGTENGKTYTLGEVQDYLQEAGFELGPLVDLNPQARMQIGVKP